MVTVDELREDWAEIKRHKQIALLALDGEDEKLAKQHLKDALDVLGKVVKGLDV